MTTQMIIRLDEGLKLKACSLAKSEGKNISAVVRDLLENYVKDRDISAYVDDLWLRTGNKLQAQGIKTADIDKTIRAARGMK